MKLKNCPMPDSMIYLTLFREDLEFQEAVARTNPPPVRRQTVLDELLEEIKPYLPKSHRDYKPRYVRV